MAKKKYTKEERRFLKKAGFNGAYRGLAGLACALDEATHGERPAEYVAQADVSHGKRTRERVRRRRWRERVRKMRDASPFVAWFIVGVASGVALFMAFL